MTMITPSYLGETIEYSSLHACRSTLEDPTRLLGVLTAAEQHLAKSLPAEKGRDLLKQVRTHLLETARPLLEAMVKDVTGRSVVSMHHDISTLTGEEVVLFTLAASPEFREIKKK